jgi:hypothetical protein
MSWTDAEWEGFAALLEEAWPGEFSEEASSAWRVLLDSTPPQKAGETLTILLHQGRRFRPSVSEFLAAMRNDPSRPTFAEAFQLIYGQRGILRAESPVKRFVTAADEQQAQRGKMSEVHPLVRSFVERQGIERLRNLPLDDSEWGNKHRRDLEGEWDRHCEAFEGREIAVLASGNGDLKQLDPLSAIPRPELGA